MLLSHLCLLDVLIVLMCVQVSDRSTQRQVNITLQKEQRGWWERLTRQERKPVFLAPDFDRWLDESDAEMEIREKVSIMFLHLWDIYTQHPVHLTAVLKTSVNIVKCIIDNEAKDHIYIFLL